ncbi:transcription factor subunit Med10 of mediator complex-domain-containing protein [Limtongia smithiae]|uniref:transcription factor subunit Med10 of mediator complex-domain-containing protein n=1 Tax=Limtongia smithiae TaxID=1125753 RepID=UPI0034CDCD57
MSSTDPSAQIPVPRELQAQEDRLHQIIETILELAISVHDYESVAQSRDAVVARVNLFTSQLAELESAARESLADVLVPREIIQYIEDGRNPNVYTREFIELLVKQNQFVNGKLHAMRDFRDVLADQIREAYPELSAEVDNVISNTGPSFPPIPINVPPQTDTEGKT